MNKAHPQAWRCPLDNIRLGLGDNGLEVVTKQLLVSMNCSDLPFKQAERVVNSADSS